MRARKRSAVAIGGGVVLSVGLLIAAMSRHPQGDITRIRPFVVCLIGVWAVVVGIVWGARWGLITALTLASLGLLASTAYVIFLMPIDYAECEELIHEISNKACRAHSALGWAVVCGVVGLVGLAMAIVLRPRISGRRRSPAPA